MKTELLSGIELNDSIPALVPCDPALIKSEPDHPDYAPIVEPEKIHPPVAIATHNPLEWAMQWPCPRSNIFIEYPDTYGDLDASLTWPDEDPSDEPMEIEQPIEDEAQLHGNPRIVRSLEDWIEICGEFR